MKVSSEPKKHPHGEAAEGDPDEVPQARARDVGALDEDEPRARNHPHGEAAENDPEAVHAILGEIGR